MTIREYKLPDPGEGLTEAEIVSWLVKVGDEIAINDVVVEIETAKSLVELPSPYAGTVTALLVAEGETAEVGTPIIAVDDGVAAAETPEIDLSNPSAGVENATLVGYGPKSGSALRRARRGPATAQTAGGSATQMQVQGSFTLGAADTSEVVAGDEEPVPAVRAERGGAPTTPSNAWSIGRVLCKPKVRRLARELGVDLAALTPSGADGVVTAEDVRQAAGQGPVDQGAAAGARSPEEADRREPVKGVRKMMAQAMVASAFTAPHVTEWITIDVTKTLELVESLKTDRAFNGVKVSPLLVLARAVCLAMRRTPEINGFYDNDTDEVVYRSAVNLGIAAATPRGLVVPNIKGAQSMGLPDLAEALAGLTSTARDGKTQPADMAGGSFTITNVGVFGVDAGTPIINPGEGAILCFGAVRAQPWVLPGTREMAIRDVTTLALSFDHRFIDGALGSQFLADVAEIMSDPARALLY